jgi:enoyl-CoA hydratase
MKYFELSLEDKVANLRFNRPAKANALHAAAWKELKAAFVDLSERADVRVVVLSGEGQHWCAGIDLSLLMEVAQYQHLAGEGRKREKLRDFIYHLQDCITTIERCRKPVLAAIHGGCIGGGVDIATACDMRYCTEEAYFTVKEIDLGLVADIGTLQRLPKLIPAGMAYELAYTGRKIFGPEAQSVGLVNSTFPDRAALQAGVMAIAADIAAKPPLVIRGIKEVMQYSREHSTADGLQYVGTYNAAYLLSDDLLEAFRATMSKETPTFRD